MKAASHSVTTATPPSAAARWKARRQRPEDGQFLAMTCVFMTMFLALAGLVADGGHYFDAKQAAASEAEQAARAGAGSLDVEPAPRRHRRPRPHHRHHHGRELHGRRRPARYRLGARATPSTPRSATACPPSSSASSASASLQITVTESATDVSGITTGG